MRRWLGVGILLWLSVALVTRLAIAPAEVCAEPTDTEIDAAITGAVDWLNRNQFDDGTFVYEYDRSTGVESPDYNVIRHAGVLMSLFQLAAVAGDDRGLDAADRGLDFAFDRLVEANGGRAFSDDRPRVDAGASALLLAGLVYRRSATSDPLHDQLMADLATFLVGQIGTDGRLLAYWDERTSAPVPEEVSAYYTGEASWALALSHDVFPDDGLDDAALEILDYLSLRRTTVEPTFPPNDDHWAAYTLDAISAWDPATSSGNGVIEDHHLAYAHRLGGSWSTQTRFDAQRSEQGLTRITRGTKDTGGFHGTGAEGVTALWRLAQRDDRFAGRADDLRALVACDAGLLVSHQVQADDERLDGAWFKGDVTRMDLQQHVLSGLVAARPILAAESPGAATLPTPTRLGRIGLGALLLVLAFDHRALAARLTTGHRRSAVAGVAGVFAFAVLATVLVVAAPLLQTARISTTSWFLVAGTWCLVAGIWRLLRRHPAPASSGDLVAGIVPLAFPTLLEPAVVTVTVLLATALSVRDAAAALAIAALALVGIWQIADQVGRAGRLRPDGPAGPMHAAPSDRWATRGSVGPARMATVLLLFAGGVLLTHGIVGLS